MAGHCLLLIILSFLPSLLLAHQYCIIGAGPSGQGSGYFFKIIVMPHFLPLLGMQLGYFLQSSGRDYVIFERNSTAGE